MRSRYGRGVAGTNRMNRQEFAAATAGLGEAELRNALWTVYWRGTVATRERIEQIVSRDAAPAGQRKAPQVPEPDEVLAAVQKFTGLVRSGAYLVGSRAVRPKERSQWRFTFRRLFTDARAALAATEPAPAEAALTELIDLACRMRDDDYVRSQDPIEAAAVVVSDEVALLWRHLIDQHGFAGFAARASVQFLRWESCYGWTRSGWGTICARERRLTAVLTELLTVPDTWVTFTDHYLRALDDLAQPPPVPAAARGRSTGSRAEQGRRGRDYQRSRRAETMTDWHLALLDRCAGTEDEALLDRLTDHPAFDGPAQTYFRARLAHARGDLPTARQQILRALKDLPGSPDFLAFARQIDAPLPR